MRIIIVLLLAAAAFAADPFPADFERGYRDWEVEGHALGPNLREDILRDKEVSMAIWDAIWLTAG